jgi:hypothetical protein
VGERSLAQGGLAREARTQRDRKMNRLQPAINERTSNERFQEIAEILAAGVLRLHARRALLADQGGIASHEEFSETQPELP